MACTLTMRIYVVSNRLPITVKRKDKKTASKTDDGRKHVSDNSKDAHNNTTNITQSSSDKSSNTDKKINTLINSDDENFTYVHNSGGLVTGLLCVTHTIPFTWLGNIPGTFTSSERAQIRQTLQQSSNVPIFVSDELNKCAYDGYCNRVLWPLFHCFSDIITYDCYDEYKEYNELFGRAVLASIEHGDGQDQSNEQSDQCNQSGQSNKSVNDDKDIVWIHDYHLLLLPNILKHMRSTLRIGLFIHIPFPSYEIFRLLPNHKDILVGMLSADLIAFHTPTYAHCFIECVKMCIGKDEIGSLIFDKNENGCDDCDRHRCADCTRNDCDGNDNEGGGCGDNECGGNDNSKKNSCNGKRCNNIICICNMPANSGPSCICTVICNKCKYKSSITNTLILSDNNACIECIRINDKVPVISKLRCKECKNTEGIMQETDSELESDRDDKESSEMNKENKEYSDKDISDMNKDDKKSNGMDGNVDGISVSINMDRIVIGNRSIGIEHIPIGIDPCHFTDNIKSAQTMARIEEYKKMFEGYFVILGVDRIDYIKGIPNRIEGYKRILKDKKVLIIQVGVPSRTAVSEYVHLSDVIRDKIARINSTYGGVTDTPIHYVHSSVQFDELCALYAVADMCVVSSVRDGMNLVAMEYVACSLCDGVLVLSEFAGTASMLPGALSINPWCIDSIVHAINRGMTMDKEERRRRHAVNYDNVCMFSAKKWAETNINYLLNI